MSESSEQWRVEFDADVTFANGGALQTQGFRLDVAGPQIGDAELGELFVRHLGLLMVGEVGISNKRMLPEPHKGSRGTVGAQAQPEARPGQRVVDLSHVIRHGMVTYPGLPGPEIGEYISREQSRGHYAPGTEFSISRISMLANTGTYVDSPFHRFADGDDIAAMQPSRFADLDAVVVRVGGAAERAIERGVFLPYDVAGRAVLIHTGWDRHFGTDRYGEGHPFLTAEAAAWLVGQRAALVGIDSVNVDDAADGARPAHTALLAAGIPIVEHLRGLEQLPPYGFRFFAVPPAVQGMGSFPVRAYALVGEQR
ncbi:cyclase family protein [Catenulispora pinisilvae]|uniref:cyclase family protein n=1 Tax=Catenulispora pinisilvae TaxID=2705253 RepID=UPI001890FA2C|nr:cyclase family protein [Catenulispora pinisilvae]